MKIRITQPRAFFATSNGERELPIGEILDITGKVVPANLINKCVVIEEPKPEKGKKKVNSE